MNDQPAISIGDLNQSATAGLARVVDELVASAIQRVNSPGADRGEDVHFVRVTIKRLRALLRLIRPGQVRFKRENARLREAAHRLNQARDSDVAWRTLCALSKSASKSAVRQAAAAAAHVFAIHAVSPEGLELEMTAAVNCLERFRGCMRRIHLGRRDSHAYTPALRSVYRQARNRMHTARATNEDTAFHRWRIRAKTLYYGLQLLEPVLKKPLVKMSRRLRKLQEIIGADHDLTIVKSLLNKEPTLFGGSRAVARIVASLDKRSRKLRRDAIRRGERIFGKKPRCFTV